MHLASRATPSLRVLPLLVLPLLALAACDRGVELTNASIADVAAATREAQRQQPGEWEATTSLEKVDVGGAMPPGVADVLKSQVGQKQTQRTCLTAKDAEGPAMSGLANIPGADQCRFDRFAMKGGRLDAAMSCRRPAGSMAVTQVGTYGEAAYDLVSTVRQELAGQPSTTMTMRIVGKRVGDCTGTTAPAG